MTWNIKTGGTDRRAGTDRLDAVAAVVVREVPDVLALQELRDFGRGGGRRMRDLAAAVGMTAHLARSVFGQPVAVLVRPPGRFTATASVRLRLHHAAAIAVLPTDRGPLTVVSTHLNPFSTDRRWREARRLAAGYGRRRLSAADMAADEAADRAADMLIVAGDLNALDPWTGHADRVARLPEPYRRRHLRRDGSVDTRTVAAFADAGLVDLWRAVGHGDVDRDGDGDADGLTAPTTAGGGTEFSGMRLDYVLGSPPVAAAAVTCRVVRGDESEYASDHYPVVVDLDLQLGSVRRG